MTELESETHQSTSGNGEHVGGSGNVDQANRFIPNVESLRLLETLTPRETEAFVLRARGHVSGGIAEAMGISVKTVDSYQDSIKYKLRLGNVREFTAFAIRWGKMFLPAVTLKEAPRVHPTKRELQVGRLFAEGRSRTEISNCLRLSVKTVDSYLITLRSKLGVRSRGNLVQAVMALPPRENNRHVAGTRRRLPLHELITPSRSK